MKRTITNTLDTPQEVLALGVTLAPGESIEVDVPDESGPAAAAGVKKPKRPSASRPPKPSRKANTVALEVEGSAAGDVEPSEGATKGDK